MLNRWQAHKGAACGEVASIIMCLEVAQHCSTSSTPNDSEVSAPRRLRYRSTSGYAWFAISDGTSSRRSLSVLRYAPTSRQGGASLADNFKNRINLCEPITHPRVLREYLHHFRGGRWAYCHSPPPTASYHISHRRHTVRTTARAVATSITLLSASVCDAGYMGTGKAS